MKAFLRRFGTPVEHPEFMWPGFIILATGSTIGAMPLIFGFNPVSWHLVILPVAMVVCGIALLMRSIIGTALYAGLIAYWINWRIESFSSGAIDWIGLALKLIMLLCIGSALIEQFRYHRHRRTKSADFILRPPDQTL